MGETVSDVVITGLGPVTSIGVGCNAFWASMSAGRSGVSIRTLPVDIGRAVELPLAAMPPASAVPGLQEHMEYLAGQDLRGYRDLGYALLAIELALTDAELEYDHDKNRIGVIQAFEAPGVEQAVCRLFQMMSAAPPPGEAPKVYDLLAPFFYHMQPFSYVHATGKRFGFHGFSTSVHNACSSGAYALELAAGQLRRGAADAMIVVGGEAFETGVRLEWFRRLEFYTKDAAMRPFDTSASGFHVGEGAGAMLLETAAGADKRGARTYATYLGGAFTQQSWKQTIPDVRAARLSGVIAQALRQTGASIGELDLIVPHGAGTTLSDGYEAACLTAALAGESTDAVATAFKPYIGHLLAASGIIEMIAAMLAMKHGSVPPTLHSRHDHINLPVPLVTAPLSRPIRTLLKLSTGFTGHDAATVFRA